MHMQAILSIRSRSNFDEQRRVSGSKRPSALIEERGAEHYHMEGAKPWHRSLVLLGVIRFCAAIDVIVVMVRD
jgi:hypothetical protein